MTPDVAGLFVALVRAAKDQASLAPTCRHRATQGIASPNVSRFPNSLLAAC